MVDQDVEVWNLISTWISVSILLILITVFYSINRRELNIVTPFSFDNGGHGNRLSSKAQNASLSNLHFWVKN